nr:GNAT family N-acetyltransferase [Micromonospora sp. DSM 115978]
MTNAVTVRRARPDDAGQVLVLQRAAYVLDAQLYLDPMIEPLTETFEDVRAAVVDAEAVLLVAAAGDRVVGFVRGRIVRDRGDRGERRDPGKCDRDRVDRASCRVDRLAVAPDWQGIGVGSALVARIEAEVVGVVDQLLADEADRGQARVRLFLRHGFVEAYRDAAGPDRVRIFLRKPVPVPATDPDAGRDDGSVGPRVFPPAADT